MPSHTPHSGNAACSQRQGCFKAEKLELLQDGNTGPDVMLQGVCEVTAVDFRPYTHYLGSTIPVSLGLLLLDPLG